MYVTEAELLQLLGNHLLAVNTGIGSDEERANMQQQIEDAVDVLPILYRGLDVNVKFCRYACTRASSSAGSPATQMHRL